MVASRQGSRAAPLPRKLRPLLRGFRRWRRLRAPARPHHQRGRQHLVHAADHEPASAAFRRRLCGKSEFGRPVVNSCLTLSIVAGMSVSDVSQKAIGNLGWTDIRLVAPVFVGDTIYAESEVLSKRESAKRPTQGDRHGADHRQESRRHRVHDL